MVSGELDPFECRRYNDFSQMFRSTPQTLLFVPIFVMFFIATSLGQIAGSATDAAAAISAARELFALLDRPSLLDPSDEEGLELPSVRGELEFAEISFAYPTRASHLVCCGYSLHVEQGTTCALCGPSGAGKSTIIQLLERFYDPQAGAVELDGVDIRRLNLRWLRQQIGLVGQEPVLFVGTVAQNIGYGKEGATREEVEEAARSANAHDFITEDLPLACVCPLLNQLIGAQHLLALS